MGQLPDTSLDWRVMVSPWKKWWWTTGSFSTVKAARLASGAVSAWQSEYRMWLADLILTAASATRNASSCKICVHHACTKGEHIASRHRRATPWGMMTREDFVIQVTCAFSIAKSRDHWVRKRLSYTLLHCLSKMVDHRRFVLVIRIARGRRRLTPQEFATSTSVGILFHYLQSVTC